MSFFKRKFATYEQIPILNNILLNNVNSNAVDENVLIEIENNNEIENQAIGQQDSKQQFQNSTRDSKHYREKIPQRSLDCNVSFHAFGRFSISRKGIRQLCNTSNGMDIHLKFLEQIPAVPRIGISCLSFDDLVKDGANFQTVFPRDLEFIRIFDYLKDEKEPINWSSMNPKKNQSITISLDITDTEALKIRFTYQKEGSTPWFRFRYPPYVEDFSLILEIHSERMKAIEALTTYGFLTKINMAQRIDDDNIIINFPDNPNTIYNLRRNGLNVDVKYNECLICLEGYVEHMLWPCGHVIHAECIGNSKRCFICKTEWQFTLKYHIVGNFCAFCGLNDGCEIFDAVYFPCGCVLGCFEGFKQKSCEFKCSCQNCGTRILECRRFFPNETIDIEKL